MATDIQVAFQGGGARVIALLGAAQGLRDLEREDGGVIKVRAVAGTSAGAIVAALFAKNDDLGQIVNDIDTYQNLIRGLLPSVPPTALGKAGVLVKRSLSPRRWTVSDSGLLEKFLKSRFGTMTFDELEAIRGCRVVIVSANVTKRQMHTDYPRSSRVADAILDSCAIPFVFRGPNGNGDLMLDGGICENLFVDELLDMQSTAGSVYGVSFDRSGQPPRLDGPVQTLLAIADTAVAHGVQRAKRFLKGRVLELTSAVDTLSFDEALRLAVHDFKSGQRQAKEFFRRAVTEKKLDAVRAVQPWSASERKWATDLWRVYSEQRTPVRFTEINLVLHAMSLEESKPDTPDELRYHVKMDPAEPVYWHGVRLHGFGDLLVKRGWSVTDAEGRPLRAEDFPINVEGENEYGYLAFFMPPLGMGTDLRGPYSVSYRHQTVGVARRLATGASDDLGVETNNAAEAVPVVRLVLGHPRGKKIQWDAHDADTSNVSGRPMSREELAPFASQGPLGYSWCGWVGHGVPPGTCFARRIQLKGA